MKKKGASFWSEIKSLDERLAQDPDSFCFARLSEVYLKVGLVSDALNTARHGVARHPGYLAGQRALAMACNASGLGDECRTILERVTAAMPEDIEAQKVLAGLYVESGDIPSAVRAYETVLDFMPEDVQSKSQLDIIRHGGVPESPMKAAVPVAAVREEPVAVSKPVEEEDILELSEDDIVYDEEPEQEEEAELEQEEEAELEQEEEAELEQEEEAELEQEEEAELEQEEEAEPAAPAAHDPLSTQTLAELYEQQGFTAKALDIYRTLLADNPGNERFMGKIAQLEQQEAAPVAPVVEEAPEFIEASTQAAPMAFDDVSAPPAAQDVSPLAHKEADNVVGTLDSWLENIRRIKACR